MGNGVGVRGGRGRVAIWEAWAGVIVFPKKHRGDCLYIVLFPVITIMIVIIITILK